MWSSEVNSGKWVTGRKKMSRKMSALELIGLLLSVTGAADMLRGQAVKIWVDNRGSCNIWKRGYSNSCRISTTLVAAVLGCWVEICKITQCSDTGTEIADALSKADLGRFRATGCAAMDIAPGAVAKALLQWAARLVVDDDLADTLLKELLVTPLVLRYNC